MFYHFDRSEMAFILTILMYLRMVWFVMNLFCKDPLWCQNFLKTITPTIIIF